MRYLSVADACFLDVPGGAWRVAWDIARLVQDAGHEVTMLCGAEGVSPGEQTVEDRAGLRIVRCGLPRPARLDPRAGRRRIAAAAAVARRTLAGQRWDVVHGHTPLFMAGAMEALGDRQAYAYTMHSPVALEQRLNWSGQGIRGRLKVLAGGLRVLDRLERGVLRRSDRIHTLSAYTKGQVQQRHGLGGRVTVIPHWRRPELRRTRTRDEARRLLGWPTDRPVLFSVRGMLPRYGVDVAIRALAAVAGRHRFHAVLAGSGAMLEPMRALARELGLAERVVLPGRVGDEDLLRMYEAADAFLLPTRDLECFGLIVLEALSFGCPVISTDACAIPELMRPILPEWVVPAGDVAALAERIEAFLAERLVPPPPERLAAYVEQQYGRETIAPRLLGWLGLAAVPTAAPAEARH